ncbi:Alkaline ceramidase 3 [Podila humilis]|nr:Alkaline ceramidase 3 [Podila humilis]
MAPVIAGRASASFDKLGYWSPNTASVDWCENNYVMSFYVAEFWNTVSNVSSLFAAGVGYHFFPTDERRFKYLFWTFYLVGIGSTLFHGTLRHKMQLLGNVQFYTFQSTYTILQFCMIYYLRVLHVQQRAIRPNVQVSTLIRHAFASALVAVSLWLIDLRLCEFVNGVSPRTVLKWNMQLHAWWHVFSACTLYHATMLIAYYHYDVRGQHPVVGKWMGIAPIIQLSSQHAKGVWRD